MWWAIAVAAIASACGSAASESASSSTAPWRLLGEARVAGGARTAIASDMPQYQFLWDAIGMPGRPPTVDFDDEVVIWFGNIVSSSPDCQDDLDEVVVDRDVPAVHPRFIWGQGVECNADENPHDHVVAVRRDLLPAGPFEIWLSDTANGWPTATTSVLVDLTGPGSSSSPHEMRSAAGNPTLETFRFEERTMPVGSSVSYGLPMCDGTRLGPANRMLWMAEGDVPTEWGPASGPAGLPEFQVLVTAAPPTITLTANEASLAYRPVHPWRGVETEYACSPIDGTGEHQS